MELTGPDVDLLGAAQLVQEGAPPAFPCLPNTISRDVNTPGVGDLLVVGAAHTGGFPCALEGNGCDGLTAPMVWINPDPMGSPVAGITLPDLSANGERASGVSDQGSIVGFGFTTGDPSTCKLHALYWHTDAGPLVDLGLATGVDPGAQTRAVRINNNQSPQAVGWDLAGHGLLWQCDGGCDLLANWSATDLDDKIVNQCAGTTEFVVNQAHDVNVDGWIMGYGRFDGVRHAVILVPDQDCQVCCFADLDCDGDVGVPDLLILLASWGRCVGCPADLTCDGTVGVPDLLILLEEWGPCGAAIAVGPPQNIQDCMDRFSLNPEDEPALIKCLELVTQ